MEGYIQLIDDTPMIVFSKFNSPQYYLENNKLVIPDHYMLRFDTWCNEIQPEIIEAIKNNPWETRKEIAFWRGKLTGMDLDLFPVA